MGIMTRVWLTESDWACCGEAFAIGDEVDFGIGTRTPPAALAELLGTELFATVDAMESHHEEAVTDRVRGKAVEVHEVTQDVIESRSLRRPGHGAPDSNPPAVGDEWPMVGRDLGNGASLGNSPTQYMIEIVPVANTAMLAPAQGVRLPIDEDAELDVEEFDVRPPEPHRRSLQGWLVDVQEHA